jgi:hypothetical protein
MHVIVPTRTLVISWKEGIFDPKTHLRKEVMREKRAKG